MKLLQYLFVVLFILYPPGTKGQDNLQGKESGDTTSLLHAFKKGKTEGHFRLFYMATGNDDALTDYYALAFGGGLKYSFDGFMKGLNAELLYLYKKRNGNIYNDRKYVINKVEMHRLNLVFNYIF